MLSLGLVALLRRAVTHPTATNFKHFSKTGGQAQGQKCVLTNIHAG
jgi:hypothetical protein